MVELLNWRGKFFWIALCGISLWTLIIMESVKVGQETRYIDSTYFWFLLIINLLAVFLLWMSGTPYIYPEEEERTEEVRVERRWYHVWEKHPAFHYATGGFGKFYLLLVFLDIFYYACLMRDDWYEVVRTLIMHSTLVIGIFILNTHNRLTTSRTVISIVGITLLAYNIVMIVKTFYLLTHSIDHSHDIKPSMPLDGPIDDARVSHNDNNNNHNHHWNYDNHYAFNHYLYRGYAHTRIYDMVHYTSLLLFFSILLKIREKLIYVDHDVLGWNSRIDLRHTEGERRPLLRDRKAETVVVNTNPLEA